MVCKKCGTEYEGKFCPNCGKSSKKKAKWWQVLLLVVVVVGVIGALGGNKDEDSSTPAQAAPSSSQAAAPKPASSATIPFETEFSGGHYTSGIDFPSGKYDIEAIAGGGNVSSGNMYSGGINAVMGTEEKNANTDMYEQKYSNINLPEGTILSISGVTVKISSQKASGEPLKSREQSNTETVNLGNGNFVAGEDFSAGVYDIVAVSGGGNVSSDNMYNGGINAILGTPDKNSIIDMYEQEYKNISLPEGITLRIDGVNVDLIPSK